ncbi:Uncharacterised protein [Mycobacteroides abscessus subsp. massiliense]|nr:Uncharacterised protein [Mycobacteroides abscessus subsp. massiliense]
MQALLSVRMLHFERERNSRYSVYIGQYVLAKGAVTIDKSINL